MSKITDITQINPDDIFIAKGAPIYEQTKKGKEQENNNNPNPNIFIAKGAPIYDDIKKEQEKEDKGFWNGVLHGVGNILDSFKAKGGETNTNYIDYGQGNIQGISPNTILTPEETQNINLKDFSINQIQSKEEPQKISDTNQKPFYINPSELFPSNQKQKKQLNDKIDVTDIYNKKQQETKNNKIVKNQLETIYKTYFPNINNLNLQNSSQIKDTLFGFIKNNLEDSNNLENTIKDLGDKGLDIDKIKTQPDYINYKLYQKNILIRLSKLLKDKINNNTNGITTDEDIKNIIKNDELLKQYQIGSDISLNNIDNHLNTLYTGKSLDEGINKIQKLDIGGGLFNIYLGAIQGIQTTAGVVEGLGEGIVEGGTYFLSRGAKETAKHSPPIISDTYNLLYKGLNWTSESQNYLGDFTSKIKGDDSWFWHNTDYIGTHIVGLTKYIPGVIAGSLLAFKAAELYKGIAESAGLGKVGQIVTNILGGTLLGTDEVLDGIVNSATNTPITQSRVKTDMFYNAILGGVSEGIFGAYAARKSYLGQKAWDKIQNTEIEVLGKSKETGEEVASRIKIGDIFKNPDDIIKLPENKGISDINYFQNMTEAVKKKIIELTSQGKKSEAKILKQQFNLHIAEFFSEKGNDLISKAKLYNKSKSGTNEFFNKMMEGLDFHIKTQQVIIKKIIDQKELSKTEQEIVDEYLGKNIVEGGTEQDVKQEAKQSVKQGTEQSVKQDIKQEEPIKLKKKEEKNITPVKTNDAITAIKFATNKDPFNDYVKGLNKIEVQTSKGIRKVSISPKTYAVIQMDITQNGVISNDTLTMILKDINQSLLGGKGNISLSGYIGGLKKFFKNSEVFLSDDIKRVFDTNFKTLDSYEKILDKITFKKEPQIGKTTAKGIGGKIELLSNIIKLAQAYRKFDNIQDFMVVLTHELTHMTEPALRELWGDELVGKLKNNWGKLIEIFRSSIIGQDLEAFKSRQDIISYLENIDKNSIDDIVYFNIRLDKSVKNGVIEKGDVNEFLFKYSDIKDGIDNGNVLGISGKDIKESIKILQQKKLRLGYILKHNIKDLNIKKKIQANLIAAKEQIIKHMQETYNIDKTEANDIYDKFEQEISDNDLNIITNLSLKRILYEMTDTAKVGNRYKGFSEYLAYTLSERLSKGDLMEGTIFSKITKGLKLGDEFITANKQAIEEASNKIISQKFDGLDKYVIDNLEETNSKLYQISTDTEEVKYKSTVLNNLRKILKNTSVDNVLSYIDSFNKTDFIELTSNVLGYSKKVIEDMVKNIGFSKVKKYIGNSVLLGIKGTHGIISGGLWEAMVASTKSISKYNNLFKIGLKGFLGKDFDVLSETMQKIISGEIETNMEDYLNAINKYILDYDENGILAQAVGRKLLSMYKNTLNESSKTIDELLKIKGLSKEEIDTLGVMRDVYHLYENYKIKQVLKNFQKNGVLDKIIDEIPELGQKIKQLNKEGYIISLSKIKDRLVGKIDKKGVSDLGYIFRIGKSQTRGYDKINFASAENAVNLSLFHNIINKLGYETTDNMFSKFIQDIRKYGIEKGDIPEDTFDVNFLLRIYGYEFKGTNDNLDKLANVIYKETDKGKNIDTILSEIHKTNTIKGLTKKEKGYYSWKNTINYFLGKSNDLWKYKDILKKGQITYEDYIDIIYNIFDPRVAKDISEKLIKRNGRTITKYKSSAYLKKLREYLRIKYKTVLSIEKDVNNALKDVGTIDIMRGKYNDIPNPLQRKNAYYSSIGGVETMSITNKQGIVFQLQKNDKGTWVIYSKGNSNASYIDKDSIFSNVFSKSELDFKEQIDNINKVKEVENIKDFINNCL